MWPFGPRQKVSVEEQLKELTGCGIKLLEEFSMDVFLNEELPRDEVEKRRNWPMLLSCLAFTPDDLGKPKYCSNVYCLDMECVDGDYIYPRIAMDIASLTEGVLKVDSAISSIDFEQETVTVGFNCNGMQVNLNFKLIDDWANPDFFDIFPKLLAKEPTEKHFVTLGPPDQSTLFSFLALDEMQKLRKLGIKTEIMR